jgi:hypothetical protein
MSGLASLLKHGGRSKQTDPNESAEDIYSKVLRRQLLPENQRLFDEELMLLLMDGFVRSNLLECNSAISSRCVTYLLAGHGTQGGSFSQMM